MRTRGFAALSAIALMALAGGCVKNYEGTRMEVNITVVETAAFSRSDLVVPTPGVPQSDPRWFSHYELHANILGEGTIRLKSFIVQPALHLWHPCSQFEEDTYCRPAAGSTCDPYINLFRFENIAENILVAVTAPATTDDGSGYAHVPGYDFMDRGRWPDALFVNPALTDPTEKLARENLDQPAVEEFCRNLPEGYYVGNPNQLTLPRHGDLFGPIDGPDPRTSFFVGGITFFTMANLEYMTELMLVRERDASRLSPENIDQNLPPSATGQVILLAQKYGGWGSISFEGYRGVMTVYMESPLGLPISWSSAIYYNMDEDPVTF